MGYDYATQRPAVFREGNQAMFLKIRDNAKRLMKEAGAATSWCLMKDCSGDSWDMLACIDRLVELGELLEVPNPHCRAGQYRIYTFIEPL